MENNDTNPLHDNDPLLRKNLLHRIYHKFQVNTYRL